MAERTAQQQGWQVDKHINIGHILLTISLIAAAFTAWSNFDRRITILEQQSTQQAAVQSEIKDELTRLNAKMDRLLESLYRRQ